MTQSIHSHPRTALCAKLVVAVSAVVAASAVCTAQAAEYTAQEKANIQVVRGLYEALDAADAAGNTKTAIVGIADKYIAPTYIQHSFGGGNGRDKFVALFQGPRMGGPPAGAPPAGGPPPNRGPMEPAKLVAIMASGNLVVQITSRGSMMIWNMFRVENGQLAEHWDAGSGGREGGPGGPPGAGGPPPGAGTPPPRN